jgi:peptidoglycan-N-acetylglucosamine deacetylase
LNRACRPPHRRQSPALFEHIKIHDFLRPKEVVLTFDDGPWQNNTPVVLKALADHCTKAAFFPIGKHALFYPEILKQVAAQGHTIGSHTWSRANLSKKSFAEAKEEIEKGVSAVRLALGALAAPFFSLSCTSASTGTDHLFGRAEHCDLLHRSRFI